MFCFCLHLYTPGWETVDKAGATLLMRNPEKKSSQIGVTVSPVKIASLQEFGSVHEIGEKLLATLVPNPNQSSKL